VSDREFGETNEGPFGYFNIGDFGTDGAATAPLKEKFHTGIVAFGFNIDAPVRGISHETSDVMPVSGFHGGEPEPDPLNPA
jgi:hypothetical protein